jgi:hypothetical protein
MNTYIFLQVISILLFIPISIIIYYLGIHLYDKNGEVGRLRKIIFTMKIGWIIYLLGHFISTTLLAFHYTIAEVLPILIITTLPVMIIHWWALFLFRKILIKK